MMRLNPKLNALRGLAPGWRNPVTATGVALAFALFASAVMAANVGELVDDRLAVERVYYAKQVGAKEPFEKAVPRSAIERRVQQEYLKEAVLRRVYRIEITPDLVRAEVERIQKSTMSPAMLKEIQASLGNNPERFARSVARPLVVDRVLRSRFESDTAPQIRPRQSADALRARLLAAKPEERAELLRKQGGNVQEIRWLFASRPKDSDQPKKDKAADSLMPKRYFADLHPEMKKVLDAQMQTPGDVSAVFGTDQGFSLYVLSSRMPEALTVLACEIPKLSFDAWLAIQTI